MRRTLTAKTIRLVGFGTVGLILALKISDLALRYVWQPDSSPDSSMVGYLDVSTGLQTLLVCAIATVLLIRAGDRLQIATCGLLFALYGGFTAQPLFDPRVDGLVTTLLLFKVMLVALNFTATR